MTYISLIYSSFQSRSSSSDAKPNEKSVNEKIWIEPDEYEEPTYDSNVERFPHKWYPDIPFLREYDGPYFFYKGVKKWSIKNWNLDMDGREYRPVEKKTKNIIVNFGPAHPAAHGVLRLILELAGEVFFRLSKLNIKINRKVWIFYRL